VRLGELSLLAGLFDSEATRAVGTLQILETVDGNTRSTGSELEKTRLLLGVPAANDLRLLSLALPSWIGRCVDVS
jgi:hypothetical protein